MFRFSKNKYFKFFEIGAAVLLMAAFFLLTVPYISWAQAPELGLNYVNQTGLTSGGGQDIRILIINVVRYLLTFLGIAAVIIIMYSGWLWMTSEGNEEKIARAKKILIDALIGLIIIISAFAIVTYILGLINNGLPTSGGGGSPSSVKPGFGASGNEIIESHYPERNQTNVARNTAIAIIFKEPMNVGDLITGSSINSSNIKISKAVDSATGPYLTNFIATTTAGHKIFVFRQIPPYMGSPSEDVKYTVALSGGSSGIHKGNGDAAWPGAGGGYNWQFTTGTFIDTDPPFITRVIPKADTNNPRNIIIQINFNEAVDPISASGPTTNFNNIKVTTSAGLIAGNYYISNGYRTVEFLTEDACGVNSCGNTVYCLPGSEIINVLVKAATLAVAGQPMGIFPADGVTDMAGNSLDGDKNGTAEGPPADNYAWKFNTTNNIDLTAPKIIGVYPDIHETNVDRKAEVSAVFDKILMSASLIKNSPPGAGSVALYANPAAGEVFYWLNSRNGISTTTALIKHENFADDTDYWPEFNSGILDIYQNCYQPASGPDGSSGNCVPTTALPYCCNGTAQANSCKP